MDAANVSSLSASVGTGNNPLAAIDAAVDRVTNKLTAYNQTHAHSLDSVIEQLGTLNRDLLEDSGGEPDLSVAGVMIFEQSMKKLKDVLSKMSAEHRDMHTSVSKVGKEIDKALTADLAGTCLREEQYENVASKRHKINTLIADKLLSQGLLDVAEQLEAESGVSLSGRDREKFQVMNVIMDSLRQRELTLAIQWAEAHRTELDKHRSPLEYSLRRLQFIQLLRSDSAAERRGALHRAKMLQPFARQHSDDMQTLMGALLYAQAGAGRLECHGRYSHLCSDALWLDVEQLFARDACAVLQLPHNNPLSTVLNAGCRALPQLLDLRRIMQQRQVSGIWAPHAEELPIEIDLGADHPGGYHSVVTCPILRQQTTEANPPMRLHCGHVISKDAMAKLSSTHRLKCPYCPMESYISDAKQVYF